MSKVTTSKAVEAAKEVVEVSTDTRRTNVCKAQALSETSHQDLATDYDTSVFDFNWTMRADGKYDKKADGKLTVEQRKELKVERALLFAAKLEVEEIEPAAFKAFDDTRKSEIVGSFDNMWNHLKSKSKHRAVPPKGKDETTEAEKAAKLLKAFYSKSTDPEAVSDPSVKADVLKIAKKMGLKLD